MRETPMREWINLLLEFEQPPRSGSNPTLVLPSWAVDEDILDRIEGLLMSVHKEEDPETRPGTWKVIEEVQKMRSYIRNGIWRNDGDRFSRE